MATFKLLRPITVINSNGTQTKLHVSKTNYTAAELDGKKILDYAVIKHNEAPGLQYNFTARATISGLPA